MNIMNESQLNDQSDKDKVDALMGTLLGLGQRQSIVSLFSDSAIVLNQNPYIGAYTNFSQQSLRTSIQQHPDQLNRLTIDRNTASNWLPQIQNSTTTRDSFYEYLPKQFNSNNMSYNPSQVYYASDLKQIEKILVDKDYKLKELYVVQAINYLTFQIVYTQQLPLQLIVYVYQKYYSPENINTMMMLEYRVPLNLSNGRSVELRILCLQNDTYKVHFQNSPFFMNPRRVYQNIPNYMSSLVNQCKEYYAGEKTVILNSSKNMHGKKLIFGLNKPEQEVYESESDESCDSDGSLDSEEKLTKKKKIDETGRYITTAAINCNQENQTNQQNDQVKQLSETEKSEFANFKENVNKYIVEKILEKMNIQLKITALSKVITVPNQDIKIVNADNLTLIAKQVTLHQNGNDDTGDLQQIATYSLLDRVPHLSEIFELYVINSIFQIQIDGYLYIIFLDTNCSQSILEQEFQTNVETSNIVQNSFDHIPGSATEFDTLLHGGASQLRRSMMIQNNLFTSKQLNSFIQDNVNTQTELDKNKKVIYSYNKQLIRYLFNQQMESVYKNVQDMVLEIEIKADASHLIMNHICKSNNELFNSIQKIFNCSPYNFFLTLDLDLKLNSIIVYNGTNENEIYDHFVLSYEQDETLENLKLSIEKIIFQQFGCSKGYYQLFDYKRSKRLDTLMNNNPQKRISEIKDFNFSIFMEDNSIQFLIGKDFFLYQKQSSFVQMREMAYNALSFQQDYIHQLKSQDVEIYVFDETKSTNKYNCISFEVNEANFATIKENKFIMRLNKIFINFENRKYQLYMYKRSQNIIKEIKKNVIATCPEVLFVDTSNMIFRYNMYNFEVGEKKIGEIDSIFILNLQINLGIYNIEFPHNYNRISNLIQSVTWEEVRARLFKQNDEILDIEYTNEESQELILLYFIQNSELFEEQLLSVRKININSHNKTTFGDYILSFAPVFLQKTQQVSQLQIQLELSSSIIDIHQLQQSLDEMGKSFSTMKQLNIQIIIADQYKNKKLQNSCTCYPTSKLMRTLSKFQNLSMLKLRLTRQWYIGTNMLIHVAENPFIYSIDFDWSTQEEQKLCNQFVNQINPDLRQAFLFLTAYKKHIMDYLIYIKTISHLELYIDDFYEKFE
ncbi:hypothetical protein TTHERM_00317300 (macronuclear) [Tetrahymena thermophila SB210]|uniref:Uncharacterized protein n=1 Tax=Tetrahymena thermophila (strain SB210) TaxID=312017 RepID=I7M2R7_TETTS|nr:hypothetical protein TTHERM_00317300 [Tetrahymena thermophila SB210]EAS01166.3 hypothetical protein TTHERM_00317300 [Tetrahymena thermophila SB210]|eukprot:XP_001021411.3 hypothetical protein TTHERM_00317300 [Tetrahymena thermophila SB210]